MECLKFNFNEEICGMALLTGQCHHQESDERKNLNKIMDIIQKNYKDLGRFIIYNRDQPYVYLLSDLTPSEREFFKNSVTRSIESNLIKFNTKTLRKQFGPFEQTAITFEKNQNLANFKRELLKEMFDLKNLNRNFYCIYEPGMKIKEICDHLFFGESVNYDLADFENFRSIFGNMLDQHDKYDTHFINSLRDAEFSDFPGNLPDTEHKMGLLFEILRALDNIDYVVDFIPANDTTRISKCPMATVKSCIKMHPPEKFITRVVTKSSDPVPYPIGTTLAIPVVNYNNFSETKADLSFGIGIKRCPATTFARRLINLYFASND